MAIRYLYRLTVNATTTAGTGTKNPGKKQQLIVMFAAFMNTYIVLVINHQWALRARSSTN